MAKRKKNDSITRPFYEQEESNKMSAQLTAAKRCVHNELIYTVHNSHGELDLVTVYRQTCEMRAAEHSLAAIGITVYQGRGQRGRGGSWVHAPCRHR